MEIKVLVYNRTCITKAINVIVLCQRQETEFQYDLNFKKFTTKKYNDFFLPYLIYDEFIWNLLPEFLVI